MTQETLFSSDMHFGHKNIIKYSNRPFANLEEMEEALIANHNSKVKPGDRWFHLGDFAFAGTGTIQRVLSRMNGEKYFLMGNHDNHKVLVQMKECGHIHGLYNDWMGKIGNHSFHLYHFPIQSWNGAFHGTVHLHGHSHGHTESKDMLRWDVGVDCWNWFPVSYSELEPLIEERKEQLQKKDVCLDPGRPGHHN